MKNDKKFNKERILYEDDIIKIFGNPKAIFINGYKPDDLSIEDRQKKLDEINKIFKRRGSNLRAAML